MSCLLEGADADPKQEPSAIGAAWACVHGEKLLLGSEAGGTEQSEVRLIDDELVIKVEQWESKYRTLNAKVTASRGRKPADVVAGCYSALHARWFLVVHSRDTMDAGYRFVACDRMFKEVDSWDFPNAGAQVSHPSLRVCVCACDACVGQFVLEVLWWRSTRALQSGQSGSCHTFGLAGQLLHTVQHGNTKLARPMLLVH
jgi:hypothetical protein